VAEAQLGEPRTVTLPQGQTVEIDEVAVGAAGIYAPGGKAAYPSSVLMGCIPAKIAGVERVEPAVDRDDVDEVGPGTSFLLADEIEAVRRRFGMSQAVAMSEQDLAEPALET